MINIFNTMVTKTFVRRGIIKYMTGFFDSSKAHSQIKEVSKSYWIMFVENTFSRDEKEKRYEL